MKAQSYGSACGFIGTVWEASAERDEYLTQAKQNYLENRLNGGNEVELDRDFPQDGKYTDWIKSNDKGDLPKPEADGDYLEGWDGPGHYTILYREGLKDKAYMEKHDGAYLDFLERGGEAAKAATLRSSLPIAHPHYRTGPSIEAPTAPSSTPATGASSSGGGAGAAPAPR